MVRVSKEPEVRRQEMIDTAMKIFARKGYEAVTMSDIAREMDVVPGLCYRYFRSKHELYETAVTQYARACSAPVISILEREGASKEQYFLWLEEQFLESDGKEAYHDFFHQIENRPFHSQLEQLMIEEILPHMVRFLERLKERGEIGAEDLESAARFILYGQMPIINDDALAPREKIEKVMPMIRKLLDS